ncbi:MAG: hypothetical protein ED859_17600 [Desulfuromonadales bacterium]|nr:MAG: hypothetical protein ED859_17600 [Desulfuromonadales bacterium]
MWLKFRVELFKRLRLKESWVIFFVLGLIMMNYPFVQIFNKPNRIADIPQLYLYFVGGWAVSILVIYLFTKACNLTEDENDEGDQR